MVGDDMAILSGGMYGNPESDYTLATPVSKWDMLRGQAGTIGGVVAKGAKMFGALQSYGAAQKQNEIDTQTLMRERDYNIKNYEQFIADQLASNKISFYASGLDYKTGTARSVIESNRAASTEDLNVMKYNYDMKLKSLKEQRKANETNLYTDMISAIF